MPLNCWRRLWRVPWDFKEIKPVNPKGNQSWIFTGRTDAEAEAPILQPPDAKNWLTGKRPWWGERLKASGEGETEDEMVGWHHRLDGHEFEQALGVGDGQGSLHAAIHRVTKSWTQLSNWTEMNNAVNKTSKLIGIYRTTHPNNCNIHLLNKWCTEQLHWKISKYCWVKFKTLKTHVTFSKTGYR